MQMTSLGARGPVIVALFAVLAVRVMAGANTARPTLVEFWHVGDDGLSQKLAANVERAFKDSPDFALSSGRKPGTLVVTIPTNVAWNKVGKKTQVSYTVKFSSLDGQEIGLHNGVCWEDTLGKCASQIVKDAKIAARNMHR